MGLEMFVLAPRTRFLGISMLYLQPSLQLISASIEDHGFLGVSKNSHISDYLSIYMLNIIKYQHAKGPRPIKSKPHARRVCNGASCLHGHVEEHACFLINLEASFRRTCSNELASKASGQQIPTEIHMCARERTQAIKAVPLWWQ
jgi:hypothetical protein